jgi:hypothetical protein
VVLPEPPELAAEEGVLLLLLPHAASRAAIAGALRPRAVARLSSTRRVS